MELRHLRYFVAVAEEGHFGRAAARLKIAQPPLSRQIQGLEKELGFQLFLRSSRSVELTQPGQILLQHAHKIFESLDVAVREAQRASRGERGRIAVGYPSSLAYSGLTELLRAFRGKAPGVDVSLRELPPQLQVDALRDGKLDVGFVRAPLEEPDIAYETLMREPLMMALPSDHPLASRRYVNLAHVARDPFVFFPRPMSPAYFDALMRLCNTAGFTPRIVQEAPQLDILSLVAAGFGVSIVPASLRSIRRAGLVLRPLVGGPTTELLIAWVKGNSSPLLRGFLDVAQAFALRRAKTRALSAHGSKAR